METKTDDLTTKTIRRRNAMFRSEEVKMLQKKNEAEPSSPEDNLQMQEDAQFWNSS